MLQVLACPWTLPILSILVLVADVILARSCQLAGLQSWRWSPQGSRRRRTSAPPLHPSAPGCEMGGVRVGSCRVSEPGECSQGAGWATATRQKVPILQVHLRCAPECGSVGEGSAESLMAPPPGSLLCSCRWQSKWARAFVDRSSLCGLSSSRPLLPRHENED